MKYILEIYAGPEDDHPDEVFESDSPLGAFSVGAAVHPSWRDTWAPGDRLYVERVEHIIIADPPPDTSHGSTGRTVKTMVYCREELGPHSG